MLFRRILRHCSLTKTQRWNRELRKFPAKVDKTVRKAEVDKRQIKYKLKPELDSKLQEISEQNLHNSNNFVVSYNQSIPDELLVSINDYMVDIPFSQHTRFQDICIVGPVNSGKSSLLNLLVKREVSTVSNKSNSTFETVSAVVTDSERQSQLHFNDVPGFSRVEKKAYESPRLKNSKYLRKCHKIILVVDGNMKPKEHWERDIEHIKAISETGPGVILAINKTDLIFNRRKMYEIIEMFEAHLNFEKTFMISCKTGFGVDALITYLHENNEPGPYKYPEDIRTASKEYDVIMEVIRSCIFNRVYKELPYKIMFDIEDMRVLSSHIELTLQINVGKKMQAPILIGKNGRNVKAISESIEVELAKKYNRPFNVKIKVVRGILSDERPMLRREDQAGSLKMEMKTAKNASRFGIDIGTLFKKE